MDRQRHLFTSLRMGFRPWERQDHDPMSRINADNKVMQFFPSLLSREDTAKFILRMQTLFEERGYCYFAVDLLENNRFIGFIGLNFQTFESDFTPCVDLGWRLHPDYWGMGLATEGALRCIDYAGAEFSMQELVAMTPRINRRSVRVMEKIGMIYKREFFHPELDKDHVLNPCLLYGLRMK